MNLKKKEEERRALLSRVRQCLRERIIDGTVTRSRIGNSLRMTVTGKADGKTRTLFVPAARQEEVARWNENWKEVRALLKSLCELQRQEFRIQEGLEDAGGAPAGAPRRRRTAKARSRA